MVEGFYKQRRRNAEDNCGPKGVLCATSFVISDMESGFSPQRKGSPRSLFSLWRSVSARTPRAHARAMICRRYAAQQGCAFWRVASQARKSISLLSPSLFLRTNYDDLRIFQVLGISARQDLCEFRGGESGSLDVIQRRDGDRAIG